MSSYLRCLDRIEFDSDYVPTFFDVGCNINEIPSHCGTLEDFTELFLSQYPNAKGYGIDALYWQSYEEKWGDRVTVIKKALSNNVGVATMYTPGIDDEFKSHAISSLHNRDCFSHGISEEEVECTTIDTLFEEFGLESIDYLKIDTEGAELMILKGAEKNLRDKRIQCIQLEYGDTYKDAGFGVGDVITYLKKFDYLEFFRTQEELLFAHKDDIPCD